MYPQGSPAAQTVRWTSSGHASYVAQAALGFVLSLALVPLCRTAATRFGYVARPRADRWHGRPTALLGGVAIATATLGLFSVLAGIRAEPVLFIGAGLMFAVGLLDDLISFTPATKLVFEIGVASLFVFFGYRLTWVHSLTLDTILTVLWIVGLTNAFNLLDNMDGLAAGLCLIAGTGVLGSLLSSGAGGPDSTYLALMLGSTAGFLVYNFHPASIFMGDSGSLFIGLSLAVLTLHSPTRAQASTNLISAIVPAGADPPCADSRHDARDGFAAALRSQRGAGRPRSHLAPPRGDRLVGARGGSRALVARRARWSLCRGHQELR